MKASVVLWYGKFMAILRIIGVTKKLYMKTFFFLETWANQVTNL